MNRKSLFSILLQVLATLMLIISCKKDNGTEPPVIKPDNRVFIVNEGPFLDGVGSLSIYYRDTEEVENNVFEKVNGFPLGNLAQSIAVQGDKVYIVVNNAGRVEVAAKESLVSLGVIDGLGLPRYFLGVSERKGYVTSWDNMVYVIDLEDNTIIGNVPTATGPEKMLMVNEEIWVLNQGGYSYDSIVTIIDGNNDQLIMNLVVGNKPSGIVQDKNGNIWVMCSGNGWNGFPGPDDTPAELICIDPVDHGLLKTIIFPDSVNHPEKLVIDAAGETMYFNYPGGLYAQSIFKETLELRLVLSSQTMYYGLGYDPISKLIYVSDPIDYVQNGKVFMIDPDNEEIIKTIDAGVIPGEFYFN